MSTVIKVFGVPEALHALRELPRRTQNLHLRIAMNAGAGILKRSAEGHVPTETKLLKRSLGSKVKIPNASYNRAHHGKPAYAVIGPRRGFVRASVRSARGKARLMSDKKAFNRVMGGLKVNVRNPARYAHLVHGGTRSHVINAKRARVLSTGRQTFGTRVTVKAKANPFLNKAVAQSGAAAQAAVTKKLQESIVQEAQRLARPTMEWNTVKNS